MPYISESQMRTLGDIADELRRFAQTEDQMGMPPGFYLKQIDRELPNVALRIKALVATIERQPAAPTGRW